MKYRTHRIEVKADNMQEKLELFLSQLDGEVVSIIPHVRTFFLFYGSRTDYILVVEKIN